MIDNATASELISVYDDRLAAYTMLYKLLQERNDSINISHQTMPSWQEHVDFVDSCPYEAWYLIRVATTYIGSIYLSRQDEIGLFLLQEHQGFGHGNRALSELVGRHVRPRYLANINPLNDRALRFLKRHRFQTLHYTMELKNYVVIDATERTE